MTLEVFGVLLILALAVLFFITEWLRMDLVALLVLGALALTGLVTPAQALSGFSNPAVVTVWAVLILSGALARTGVAGRLGRLVLRLAGEGEARLLAVIMITAGVLSGFMNSIGVASLLLPVVIDISRRTDRPPSRLLIPLAFASLMGGLNTLIGTPPNLLISESLRSAGLQAFEMFDYTPVGLAVLLTGIIFMLLIGRHLLPERDIVRELAAPGPEELKEHYDLQERMTFLRVPGGSPLHGSTLAESRLGSALELTVLAVFRGRESHLAPGASFTLRAGDRLLVEGRMKRWRELSGNNHLELKDQNLPLEEIFTLDYQLAELEITSDSGWKGQTLRQIDFWQAYQISVVAIRRGKDFIRTNLGNVTLKEGDVLLVQGQPEQLEGLGQRAELYFRRLEDLEEYQLQERVMLVKVPQDSVLVGKTLPESRLGDAYGLDVLTIIREEGEQLKPDTQVQLQAGDALLIKGKEQELRMISGLGNLEILTTPQIDLNDLDTEETGLLEVVLSPHSTLVGKSLRELDFRTRFGLSVVAIWREGRAYRSNLREMKLRFGDALLLFGPRQRLKLMGSEGDFLVLSEKVAAPPRLEKAPLALLIMTLVLVPVIAGWLPIALSTVVGAALMVLTGCLEMDEAYRQIEWRAVFLIAGMLPLGIAMQETGAANLLGEGLISLIGGLGPLAVLIGLFLLAVLGSQFMPNPAVAVLLAPIALSAAAELGVSPYPLMMTVAVSSSAAFLSPVGHPANLLVMGPGGYRFRDYFRVGLPLSVIVLVVVSLILPIFFPF
jgi:di/tricarboxylate transporter